MSEPEWNRLPHDPQGFFGLPATFDRQDLKRQYNRLIKQFKPEKFPQEFQKIRSAYEALDQRLRYGDESILSPVEFPKYHWSASDMSLAVDTPTAGPDDPNIPPSAVPLFERLRIESPAAIAQELRGIDEKQPYHFFALALLEDVLPDRETQTFLKWLLRGLQRWPRDPGLCELLTTYLKQEVPPQQAGSILRAVAKVIRDDRFFYLTEELWDLHLRNAKFREFRATLQACEAQLVDHRIAARLAFYVHILKPAMWLADDDWVDELLHFINSEGARLAWRFEGDLEVLFQLREYIQHRHDLLDGNPIRAEMDQVVRSYCLDREPEFDTKYLSCAVRLGSAADEVLTAFAPGKDVERYGPLYRLWLWIDNEVSARHGITDDSGDASKLVKSARGLLRRIQELSDRTNVGSVWTVTGLLYLSLKGGIYVAAIALLWGGLYAVLGWLIRQDSRQNTAAALGIVGGAILGWCGDKWGMMPLWHKFCRYWALVCYRRVWRKELLPFLKQTRLPYGDFVHLLSQAERDDIHCSGWICYYCQLDYGLAFAGLAQRYIV